MNGLNPTGNWVSTMQWGQIPTPPGTQTSDFTQMSSSPFPTNQDSQQNRIDLIRKLYRTILGREPDDAGLEYYLRNSFIPEHQIAKDMYESKEHADLLMKAKDVMEMISKLNDITQQLKALQEENQRLKQLNENLTAIVQSYKSILESSYPTTPNTMQQSIISASSSTDVANVQSSVAPTGTSSSTQLQPQQAQQQGEPTYIIPDPFADEENNNRNPIKRALSSWFKFD